MEDPNAGTQPIFVDVSNAPEQDQPAATPAKEEASGNVKVKSEKDDQELLVMGTRNKQSGKSDGEPKQPVKVITMNGERFKCMECNRYSAETEEQVQRHIRKMHRGQNPFQCYMCDYSTYNKPLFEEHVRIHRGIKPFKCSHCSYRSASKKNAKKHELIHRPDNPLKCPSCPFIGRHVRSFNHHKRQHSKGSTSENDSKLKEEQASRESAEFVCEHCGTDFAVARNLASHQRNVKKCDECDAVLCSKFLYKRHMLAAHSRAADDGAGVFRCGQCAWRGSHSARVLLHLLHHPQPPPPALDAALLRAHGVLPPD